MGILANNEWREGWLDEGFTSFQTTLFDEATRRTPPGVQLAARGDEAFITGLDLDGQSEPASLLSEEYRDFITYNIRIYTRGELFFHQLPVSWWAPDDAADPPHLLRPLEAQARGRGGVPRGGGGGIGHGPDRLLRSVAAQHGAGRLFGGAGDKTAAGRLGGWWVGTTTPPNDSTSSGWSTQVEVVRKAPGRVPVEVWVIGQSDTAAARSIGLAEREWVTVRLEASQSNVARSSGGDPGLGHDEQPKKFGFHPMARPRIDLYLDTWFSTPVRRDKATMVAPHRGTTIPAGSPRSRHRSGYFGRFEQNQFPLVSGGTGWATSGGMLKAWNKSCGSGRIQSGSGAPA